MSDEQRPLLLYDGECGFCHGTVATILRWEKRHDLLFASQQSSVGRRLLAELQLPFDPDTVVLVENGRAYLRSDAALRTLALMGGIWIVPARLGRLVPRMIRDGIYRIIARWRISLGGTRSEACSIPSVDVRNRFLA